MKICCFIDSLTSGGAQRQLVNLACLLKEQGHTIDFLIYRNDLFYNHFLSDAGIDVTYISNKSNIDRIRKIRSYLRKYDGDIVISFLETPNFLACFSAIGPRKWKLITNELSAKETSFTTPRGKVFKFFERFSDWTVCNSENAKRMWVSYYPEYQSRISTIYNPIIIDCSKYSGADNSDGRRHIVIAATYQYLKNPIRLIKAVSKLTKEERSRLRIDWYGRKEVEIGNKRAYLEAEQLIQDLDLQETITLNDETKDIYKKMFTSDAVALFSTVEGLPNAICEGMMLGKPVIMSKVSDYSTFVTKENGFLCDPLDEESIYSALVDFMNTPNKRLKVMGEESARIARTLFSPAAVINEWEKLFDQLIET